MSGVLGYADAVRLLGGDSGVMAALDKVRTAVLGSAISTFIGAWEDEQPSAAHALLDVLLLPARGLDIGGSVARAAAEAGKTILDGRGAGDTELADVVQRLESAGARPG